MMTASPARIVAARRSGAKYVPDMTPEGASAPRRCRERAVRRRGAPDQAAAMTAPSRHWRFCGTDPLFRAGWARP
jgi:hypothetical protein